MMMQHTIGSIWLLAARQDLTRVWGRFDHQRPSDGSSQVLILAGMAVFLAAVLYIWLRAARRPKHVFNSNNPARLFRELCGAHGLGFSDRRLLKRLAAARGDIQLAHLFIEPENFDQENLPVKLKPFAGELQQLQHQLFD